MFYDPFRDISFFALLCNALHIKRRNEIKDKIIIRFKCVLDGTALS